MPFSAVALRHLLLLAIAPLALAQQGSISGTVIDASGAAVGDAMVRLSLDGRSPDRETRSAERGDYSFTNVSAGPYRLSFSASGLATRTVSGELRAGETLSLPPYILAVANLTTDLTVTQTQSELAEAQIKAAEQQRFFGLVPNFFAAYDRDSVPLNAKQKLELTGRTWLDPSSFAIEGIIAGVWQAENTHKGFGQGAQGYAKRYGAGFADYGTRLLLEKAVMTTMFRQDPRYFYRGTGTKRSRAFYAVSRSFVCRGDDKSDQFCYSSLIARFGTGFAINYLYPAADRDRAGTILRNSAIGLGFDAAFNLFQEFAGRRLTPKKR